MTLSQQISFGSYRLDVPNARLWQGDQALALPPKVFAMLCYMVEHAGRLITKDELLDNVWDGRVVSEGVLKTTVQLLRKTLEEDGQAIQYIETVPRRGYRFIAEVKSISLPTATVPTLRTVDKLMFVGLDLPGRAHVLVQLQDALVLALKTEQQLVFVTGEPGIGKTTLLDRFLQPLAAMGITAVRGQCVEQYGQGEPYLPVLEALNSLCRQCGAAFTDALRQYAPTWLVQLPWVLTDTDRTFLQQEVMGATKERMLREMGELLEHWTVQQPLVMVLEDLHWSDYATLDLMAYLAHRCSSARWLLLGSYRPVDVIVHEHPLKGIKRELQLHGLCQEIALELLSKQAVADYLGQRFVDRDFPDILIQTLHARTEGLPLFMVNLVEYWLAESREDDLLNLDGLADCVPATVGLMIEKQLDQLPTEIQSLLATASVVGMVFPVALLADLLQLPLEQVEDQCETLARKQQFLRATEPEEWPDGTFTASHGFLHALYQHVLYQRVTTSRQVRWHRRIAEKLEQAYGTEANRIAAILANHFEQGRDYPKTIYYLRLAVDVAAHRFANREALGYLQQAINYVPKLLACEQFKTRWMLLIATGFIHQSMGNMPEASQCYRQAADQANAHGDIVTEAQALAYQIQTLRWFDPPKCYALSDKAMALTRLISDEPTRVHIQGQCAGVMVWHRWDEDNFIALEKAVEYARQKGDVLEQGYLLSLYAGHLCYGSRYREAERIAQEAMRFVQSVWSGFHGGASLFYEARSLVYRGQWGQAQQRLNASEQQSKKNGNLLGQDFCRAERAMLHLHALQFDYALNIGCDLSHSPCSMVRFYGLALAFFAYFGLGQAEQAYPLIMESMQGLAQEGRQDWMYDYGVQQALAEYWLANGDTQKAHAHAEQFRDILSGPRERTFLTQSHVLLTRIALQDQDFERAGRELQRALTMVDNAEVPLVAWQVYALAGGFYEAQGKLIEAQQYWSNSAAVIRQLADSLEEHDPLRAKFLSAEPVRQILGKVGA